MDKHLIIAQTKKWILDVVVGCNFCPFAAPVVKQNLIHYQVEERIDTKSCLEALLLEIDRLDKFEKIETSFLILPNGYQSFDDYLSLVEIAEELLDKNGYEGVYQLASFHPLYQFAGSALDDPANYTNRSVYPMLHLLREDRLENAIATFKNPAAIPDRNISFARSKGLAYMQHLLKSSYEV